MRRVILREVGKGGGRGSEEGEEVGGWGGDAGEEAGGQIGAYMMMWDEAHIILK